MCFRDRRHAGKLLAEKLQRFGNRDIKDAVVYVLPRGGVVTGAEIANRLHVPIRILCVRKIRHPDSPEYAIGAVSEHCQILNRVEVRRVDPSLLQEEIRRERREVRRMREIFQASNSKHQAQTSEVAIIVDDGVATGYTIMLSIREIKRMRPKKLIVAVPVVPSDIADMMRKKTDAVVNLYEPVVYEGAVSSYYESFPQVTDEEVKTIMKHTFHKTQ